jgi:RNA polymerase-binding transcription factor DksA
MLLLGKSKILNMKTTEIQPKTMIRYSDEKLDQFKIIIEKKIQEKISLLEKMGYDRITSEHSENPPGAKYDNSSHYYNKENNQNLAARILNNIADLKNALIRIGNKSYGVCRTTGELISEERLKLTPHATLSIEAKINRDK